jgi:hypothetical protein
MQHLADFAPKSAQAAARKRLAHGCGPKRKAATAAFAKKRRE